MKTALRIASLFLAGFLFNVSGGAEARTSPSQSGNQYYLAPSGSDSNSGAADAPWQTLDKANRTLKPGDTVILRQGSYSGIIEPVFSGESTARAITYRSENRHGAVLTGKTGLTFILNLKDKRFITIEGIKMLPQDGGFGFIEECDHFTLQNCHLEGSTRPYFPLEFIKSPYIRMINNTLARHVSRDSDSRINGNMCNFKDCSHILIERNDFSKVGHCPLSVGNTVAPRSAYNVIRGNCFHNGWGRNFELFCLARTLFENNIITDAFDGARSADSSSKVLLLDGIFRNNLVYGNWGVVFAFKSYELEAKAANELLELSNSRFYNNTFANNPAFVWEFGSSDALNDFDSVRSNLFANNLFYRNDYAGNYNTLMMVRPGISPDNLFHNNLFFGEKPGQAGLQILKKRHTADTLNRELPTRCRNNLDADPLFVNLQKDCFALSEGSPAINAGRCLTRAVGSGGGRELKVEDARCFFDGFGIEGERGDVIAVGKARRLVRVLKSDIDKNVLTLDSEITWKEGDSVSLPYAEIAPDIGAFQHGDTGVLNVMPRADPILVKAGDPISFSALISGAKGGVKYVWDFGDGTLSEEEKPVHTYRKDNDYVVRLRCSDASGVTARGMLVARVHQAADPNAPMMQTDFEEASFEEWAYLWDRRPRRDNNFRPEKRPDGKGQCLSVFAAGKTPQLAVNAKMRLWDIDQYPYVSFSYRIPTGVPVGVWLNNWPAENKMDGICLGGSPANSAGRFKNVGALKLMDDGQWHTAVFDARAVRKASPGFKLAYAFEFTTFGVITEGQKFWFDDFAITPNLPDGKLPVSNLKRN